MITHRDVPEAVYKFFRKQIDAFPEKDREHYREAVAGVLFELDIQPGVSTGIHGGITYGYGDFDEMGLGFFEFTLSFGSEERTQREVEALNMRLKGKRDAAKDL